MPAEAAASIQCPDTVRITALRRRVRDAMEQPPVAWRCPKRIDECYFEQPIPIRKARALELKLSAMPTDLWDGQLFAGSMTLEQPRVHAERGFPEYTTAEEREEGRKIGANTGCFGHIVPDYPRLLTKGLRGIRADAETQKANAQSDEELTFLHSAIIAVDAVTDFAARLARRCGAEAEQATPGRARELRRMADNLRQVPAGPAETFWQALQSVWLLHMIFHSTMNGNACGRLDQYAWPLLEADLAAGRLDMDGAAELIDCFCLKFNERAKTTDDQLTEAREEDDNERVGWTRHGTSSQWGTKRDRLDATNHWLQNIVVGGLTPTGEDGTNPLTYLLLRSYWRNRMTNPLLTVRVHRRSPQALLDATSEVLKDGGGMPAIFNDEQLVPALENLGIPTSDARDYTNDGCWEVILPGRTDFKFQRLSVMLCLEWALNRGVSRIDGKRDGVDTGDPRQFASWEDVWQAFVTQLDHMIGSLEARVVGDLDVRSVLAPVPLLSALIEGAIERRRDMTAGGAKFRTFALLAESAAHCIDSLTAIKHVIFEQGQATMAELCDALDADFEGYEALRARLLAAPKYGNDDEGADAVGQQLIEAFCALTAKHAEQYESIVKFPCGVGTFSWYIGIGQGLGASPDGRVSGDPVSSNFSPALGRDHEGHPSAILSYSKMHKSNLPAGGPLDMRIAKRLVEGREGTKRMSALIRGLVEAGGNMMTLTVADTEELRAAQQEPENYRSLRVRMGGWCAYFTMLSPEQQDHHLRRQEARA